MSWIDRHLEGVSRTFALCIPLLPPPTDRAVGLAYLWMRVADTFEDTTDAPLADRLAGLDAVSAWMKGDDRAAAVIAQAASALPGLPSTERALLDDLPRLASATRRLPDGAHGPVAATCAEMAEGMAAVLRSAPGGRVALPDLPALRAYCRLVAGIVGEMLTELFLLDRPGLAPAAPTLRRHALAFGEALQLVNILKDATTDARAHRRFVPPTLDRAVLFELARADLREAEAYIDALRGAGAPPGVVAFADVPAQLAAATHAQVEAHGPGATVSRAEVERILAGARASLSETRPPCPTPG